MMALGSSVVIRAVPMLLCLSRPRKRKRRRPRRCEDPIHLAGGVALETPKDLALALALRRAPRHVLAGAFVPAHPSEHQYVKCPIGVPVTTAVEAVGEGLARGGLSGGRNAKVGGSRPALEPFRGVSGGG